MSGGPGIYKLSYFLSRSSRKEPEKCKKTDFLLFLFITIMALTGTLAYLSSSSALAGGRSVITDARESVQLPVLMYHGITKDPSEVSEYTISAETFESDLEWLGDNGFTAVYPRQITDYVEKRLFPQNLSS